MNNSTLQNRNNSIEFLRFLFMSILVAWHTGFHFFAHGYLVVEFFFILSGYFIYTSLIKKNKGTLQYTIDKIKRTYLEYIIACAFMFGLVALHAFMHHQHFFTLDNLFKFIVECLLLQSIGIFDGGFNAPLWYFSVLIWGGGGLYALLKYNKRLTVNIILPLYILLFYTYIFSKRDAIECWDKDIFLYTMLRGFADMSVGIVTAELSLKILPKIKKSLLLFDIVSVISFILLLTVFYTSKTYDKYTIIFIPILILNCIDEKGILHRLLNKNFSSKLGGITYEMYILHAPILMVLGFFFKNTEVDYLLRYIISLLIIIICSKCMKMGCCYINKRFCFNL